MENKIGTLKACVIGMDGMDDMDGMDNTKWTASNGQGKWTIPNGRME
jgi:hypothetical protein